MQKCLFLKANIIWPVACVILALASLPCVALAAAQNAFDAGSADQASFDETPGLRLGVQLSVANRDRQALSFGPMLAWGPGEIGAGFALSRKEAGQRLRLGLTQVHAGYDVGAPAGLALRLVLEPEGDAGMKHAAVSPEIAWYWVRDQNFFALSAAGASLGALPPGARHGPLRVDIMCVGVFF